MDDRYIPMVAEKPPPSAPVGRLEFRYCYVANRVRLTILGLPERDLRGTLHMTKGEWHAFQSALLRLGDESEIEFTFKYEGKVG